MKEYEPVITWDDDKNKSNIKKHHGISFDLAQYAFLDEFMLIEEAGVVDHEQRLAGIGRVISSSGESAVVLLVVHTYEDDQGQDGAQDRRRFSAQARGDADGRGQPNPGGRRQPFDFFTPVPLDDGAGPEESDAGDQALQHPGDVGVRDAGLLRDQDEESRAERHQHVRAQPRRLPFALPLEAEQAAEDRRDQQAQRDPRKLARVGDIGEFIPDRAADLFPKAHGDPPVASVVAEFIPPLPVPKLEWSHHPPTRSTG